MQQYWNTDKKKWMQTHTNRKVFEFANWFSYHMKLTRKQLLRGKVEIEIKKIKKNQIQHVFENSRQNCRYDSYLRNTNLQKHWFHPLTCSVYVCCCLCGCLSVCVLDLRRLAAEPDSIKREGRWNQSTPKLPRFSSSQAFSLRLDRSHKTIYLGVSAHRGKQWNMVFSLEMWGETDCKPPWHESSTPTAFCATMSANCLMQ